MKNKTLNKSLISLLCLCLLMVMCSFSNTFAWRGGHGGGFHGRGYGYRGGPYYGYTNVVVGAVSYYYFNGVYYSDYPEGYVVAVPQPVPSPVVAAAAQPASQASVPTQPERKPDVTVTPGPAGTQESIGDTISVTIYIPHSRGRYNSIKLVKCQNGYIGPMGEFYPNHPTVAQLLALYGN